MGHRPAITHRQSNAVEPVRPDIAAGLDPAIVLGGQIPNPANWGLDFAMVVTFIGIVVPLVKNRPMVLSVIVSGGVALLTNGLPNKIGLMIAALSGIAAGIIARRFFGLIRSI